MRKVTDAMPDASCAVAPTRNDAPAPVSAGAASVTIGASVSGCASMVNDRAALPVLPLGSVATAVTSIVVPGETTLGMATVRSYGAVVDVDGCAPSTAKATEVTETLSTALAVTTTSVPGSTRVG